MSKQAIAYGGRCPACQRMHGPDECRLKRAVPGVIPAPATAPPQREGARALPAAPKPEVVPDDAVRLPADVLAIAREAAGAAPVAEWLAALIRALPQKPKEGNAKMTPAEKMRAYRARKKARGE